MTVLAGRIAQLAARRASSLTARATSSTSQSSVKSARALVNNRTVTRRASSSDASTSPDVVLGSWVVVGCDSDGNGALCVLTGPSVGAIERVIVRDNPTRTELVNGRARPRLDPEAMTSVVRSLGVPKGTTVYLEEGGVEFGFSAQTAFVQGYNFGLWRGVFAAAELEVRVVKPQAWKAAMGLKSKESTKDDSIAMAKTLFPEIAHDLKRKKDHGRAESLLIAAYGHVANGGASADVEDEICARVRAALADRGLVRDEGGALPYFGPYFGMTGEELRTELKRRGAKVSGNKQELILRLETNDEETKARQSETA